MKFPMPREYKYIRSIDDVWYGQPDYKESLIVPEINAKYGSLYSKIKTMPSYANFLIGSFIGLFRSVRSIKKNPYSGQNKISKNELIEFETYAKSLGVSSIGYTMVNKNHMFKDSVVLFQNAIVLTMVMRKSEIECAPSKRTNKEVFRTYYELGKSVNLLSDFLRSKGYNTQPVPSIGSNLNLSLLAKNVGLGGFGKNGLIMTKEFGPSVRLAAVLTDIDNLPLNKELNQKWIKEFCSSCNACVRKCPAKAIYENPVIFEDGSEQHIDFKMCAVPFSKQYGCTVCIKECVFFKNDYNKIKKIFTKKMQNKELGE